MNVFVLIAAGIFLLTGPSFAEIAPGTGEKNEDVPYKHTNSKGVDYFLRSTLTRSKDGKARTFYYFTKKRESEKGRPVGAVPEAYEVSETKNGLPVLKKKKPAQAK